MKTQIILQSDIGELPWAAIVRGDLALHTTPAKDCMTVYRRGPIACWTVTHVPTGLAVLCVVGCAAGRLAYQSVRGLDFGKRDQRLLKKLNTAVRRLRKAGVETVTPRPGHFFRMPPAPHESRDAAEKGRGCASE